MISHDEVSPFGHLRIEGCLAPPRSVSPPRRVLHRLPKPRHPPYALQVSSPTRKGRLRTAIICCCFFDALLRASKLFCFMFLHLDNACASSRYDSSLFLDIRNESPAHLSSTKRPTQVAGGWNSFFKVRHRPFGTKKPARRGIVRQQESRLLSPHCVSVSRTHTRCKDTIYRRQPSRQEPTLKPYTARKKPRRGLD